MKYVITSCFFILLLISNAQVSIQSTLPGTLGVNAEIKFDVRISKGAVANFSKYQIDVPEGVTLSEVESKGGAFSFDNNRAKIIWVNTPPEADFIVSMKLKTGPGTGSGFIHQKFYYLENDTKREIEAEPVNVIFSTAGTSASSKLSSALAQSVTGSPTLSASNAIVETASKTTPPVSKPVEKAVVKEPVKPTQPPPVVTEPAAKAQTTPANPAATDGIVYRVQLAASTEKPSASKYAGIQPLEISKEGTMFKVLVGTFTSKDDAIKMKNDLAAKGFNGFVVAYQNGQRIK